jgi:hypothetical protein
MVERFFRERGDYIIPTDEYSGWRNDKAPLAHGPYNSLIIPDLDTFSNGRRRWVEVKTKRDSTLTRMSGQYEHGMPLKHYYAYQSVQRESGCVVCLAVYEIATGMLLFSAIDDLGEGRHAWMAGEWHIFFPRDKFEVLHEFIPF